MNTERIVIVGAGHAGFTTAAALRESGYAGKIALLDSASVLPYERPPLSKSYLDQSLTADAIAFRDKEYFARNAIDLRTGVSVRAVDRDLGQIVLSSGDTLSYTHLVLATGTRARSLPIASENCGILLLRTIDDAQLLDTTMMPGQRLVILGGGFIGAEVAATAARRGLKVTVVEAGPHLMGRAVSEPTARYLARCLEELGAEVLLSSPVTAVDTNSATRIVTANGRRLEADHVLAAVGVVPDTELAARAGLAVDDGILVDETLLTSDPTISAVGDCARVVGTDGSSRRIESVQNATEQARCIVARLTGHPRRYAAVPWFWSNQGEQRLQIVGHARTPTTDLIRGTPTEGHFSVIRSDAEGRVVAIESINDGRTHAICRRLLESAVPVSAGELVSPSTDLTDYAKKFIAAGRNSA